jgi:NAD(P)-dependent dehydrogenase (short-subunit alcohol dehydrogenase family)
MGWTAGEIPDLSGSVAIVTGGNGGLGYEVARELAAHGATVVIAARDAAKSEAARRRILAQSPNATVEVRALDLGSLASVEEFANGVQVDHPAVDRLFANAGIMGVPEGRTADGFETQLGVNYLGHFALTTRLMPALLAAAAERGSARVVTTTSMSRFQAGRFDLADLQLRGHYRAWIAYGISKRAMLEFAFELERRLSDRGIHGFAADPGFSRTDLQAKSVAALGDFEGRASAVAVRLVGQSARMGALPLLRAGTDPNLRGGLLVAPRWISFGSPVVRAVRGRMADPVEHAALWTFSERETGVALAEPADRPD